MKSLPAIIASPLLCLAALGGILLESRGHARPEDAAPFHARAREAIEAWPRTIGEDWVSHKWDIPPAAIRLLRPNAVLGLTYLNLRNDRLRAELLIVQCGDPSDMSGHFPPNCYPNNGEPLAYTAPRFWKVGDMEIRGMEYHFEQGDIGQPRRRAVYNFFVLPGKGIVPDMEQVREATGDYQRRYFGAAQFQLVFPADMPQDVRDGIFDTIIGADLNVLKTLNPAGI